MAASVSDSSPASPPPPLLQADPEGANLARQRIAQKSHLARFLSKTNSTPLARRRSSSSQFSDQQPSEELAQVHVSDADNIPISLDNSALIGEDIYTDRYEWAVLYENQRGMTIFAIPYYSSLSLLPSDPSPFTLPHTPLKRSKQPPVSLENYPLPDGNWHWVSRCWMIDMRSDSGEVQHDGFEYNWMFRQHKWRAQVGSLNAGGWVRRRRWVRLMVRPAKSPKEDNEGLGTPTSASVKDSGRRHHRYSAGSSFPPSVGTGNTASSGHWGYMDLDEVWLGDAEADWQRCRSLMKHFGRDGRKLELWRLWLGFYHPDHKQKFVDNDDKGKRREKQWSEDEIALPSELPAADIVSRETVSIAPRDHVIAVLHKHGQHMLHLFVFPESRAQFLKLLGQAGLLPELNTGLGIGSGAIQIDFWSYASGLGDLLGAEELRKTAQSKALQPTSERDAKSNPSWSVATI